MTIDRMRHEIKLRWNKLNSNHKKDFPDAYLDDIINDAINEYIEIFYSGNNSKKYRIGFEVTQQRIDMLSTLVVPHKSVATTQVVPNVFKIDLNSLTPKYKHFLRASFTDCNKRIKVDMIRHNDFDVKMMDENTKPSIKWGRALAEIKSGTNGSDMYIYSDTTTVPTLDFEYLKKPAKVFSSGYDSLEYINGDNTAYTQTSPKVHCDLPEDYHTIVVDIAVQNIAGILEDNQKFAFSENKNLTIT